MDLEQAASEQRLLHNGKTVNWDSLGSPIMTGDTVELLSAAASPIHIEPQQTCSEPGLGCLKGRRIGRAARSRPPSMAIAPLWRREVLSAMAAAVPCALLPTNALADSSGRFTTVTTAKRRYYGRVKQGVFEFLALGAAVTNGELQSADVSGFFAETLESQTARTRTQCEGGGDACVVEQRFSSRWEDMKTSMYLLGNAFRTSGGTAPPPPDKVKQVKEAKAFMAQVEKLRKASVRGDRKDATLSYAAALDALSTFLNDVDLPPISDPEYRQRADTQVASLCQGSFCL